MRNYSRVPLAEAVDKYSILFLKKERLPDIDEASKKAINNEFLFYSGVIEEYRADGLPIKEEWVKGLIEINGRCWDMEAAIKQGREGTLTLEEVGRRTLVLRDMNRERIALKNKIAEESGIDFFEVKVDHASEK